MSRIALRSEEDGPVPQLSVVPIEKLLGLMNIHKEKESLPFLFYLPLLARIPFHWLEEFSELDEYSKLRGILNKAAWMKYLILEV